MTEMENTVAETEGFEPGRRPLRIFVAAHNCRNGGGISAAKNLIGAFGAVAPENEYMFTVPHGLGYEECGGKCPKGSLFAYKHSSMIKRLLWETYVLPHIVEEFNPDVVFNLANRSILRSPAPQATLVNDAHMWCNFDQFGKMLPLERFMFWYHRRHVQESMECTDLFLTQTELAAEGMRSKYGKDLKVSICYNCVSVYVGDDDADRPLPKALQGSEGKLKLFCLAQYYSHKNLDVIVRMFEEFPDAMRDVVVVITIGPEQHPGAKKMLRRIRKLGFEDRIINVGPLKQSELGAYYTNCDAVFLPTLLESSSATYIEAMYFERPILTSDLDFAHAACGNAALYFDPWRPEAIVDVIMKFKKNQTIRDRLIEAGRERRNVRSHSWEEVAQSVLRELAKVAKL